MPKVKNVEKRIWDIEGFDVQFKANEKDVRGDKDGIPQYPFDRAAKNDMTVKDWKRLRFGKKYAGFKVCVVDGDGKEATGQMKLGTLRDTYQED